MPSLTFEIVSSHVKQYAAMPTLAFDLEITNHSIDEEVYAAALKCQIMIEAVKRRYDQASKDRLFELFGEHTRWDDTLRTVFWQIVHIPVPAFKNKIILEVNVPCSEEISTAAGKYFFAVRNDEIPLNFLFSGTLFYRNEKNELEVILVPWEKEARYRMPAVLWQDMMEMYFPQCRWLSISKSLFERLVQYKARTNFLTLNACVENMLEEALETLSLEN